MIERFSASVAAKHLACPASANLRAAIPGWQDPPDQGETKASLRGTSMHSVAESAAEFSAREMLALADAIRYVAELRQRRRFKVLLEAKGEGWWLSQTPPPRTTSDVVLHVADELHVVDYKFGTIPISAHGNTQGMYYALAFLPLAPRAKGVHFHIVQPLADNYDEVFFTLDELEQFRLDTIAAEKKILDGDTTFNPSDACMFCPANPHGRGAKGGPYCPAMLKLLYPPKPVDEDAVLDLLID